MRKILYWFAFICFTYFIYGLVISQYNIEVITPNLNAENPDGLYDYQGVVNVHTTLSSGSGSYEEVITEAQTSGLDFIFFTDLNLFNKPNIYEGYHQDLLVFVEGEYSYLDSRLINIGAANDDPLKGLGQSQVMLAEALSKKNKGNEFGILILAHPFKEGHEWLGKYPIGIDGIEILNLKDIWERAWLKSRASFVWTLLLYPFNPELSFVRLLKYPDHEIDLWDKLQEKREVIGILGSDAEAKVKLLGTTYISVPSYLTIFNIVRNHVLLRSELTGDPVNDREKILTALRAGQFYMSLDIIGNPKGFNAFVSNGSNDFLMGSSIKFAKNLSLTINLPQKPMVEFDINIYRNGEKIATYETDFVEHKLNQPGQYRAVVFLKPRFPFPDRAKRIPWILTNSFYLQ